MKKLLLALLLFATSANAGLAPGTIGLWFDSTKCATELSDGTGINDLSEVGNPLYDAAVPPPVGSFSAHGFTIGTDFYEQAGFETVLYNTRNSWTVQAYVYVPNYTLFQTLIAYNSFFFGTLSGATELRVDSSAFGALNSSGAGLPTNQWVHIAMTYDGADYRFYVDGDLITTGARVAIPPPGAGNFRIGAYFTGGIIWGGRINQLRIMNTVETIFPTVDEQIYSEIVRVPDPIRVPVFSVDTNPARVP